jgi:hypothetical protein
MGVRAVGWQDVNPVVASDNALALGSISLEELVGRAALLTRQDVKYFVPREDFEALAAELAADYVVLEIDGRRTFAYDTMYFDGAGFPLYYSHLQRRRQRFKARSRRYLDGSLCVIEVKFKGRRGETVKRQLPWDSALHGHLTDAGREFIEASVSEAFEYPLTERLRPALQTSYRRLTIVHRELPQRLTCDFDLVVSAGGLTAEMRNDLVLVESKSEHGRGQADVLLRHRGLRPVAASKYCLGLAVTHPEVRANDFRRVMAGAFEAAEPAGPPWPRPLRAWPPAPVVDIARVRRLRDPAGVRSRVLSTPDFGLLDCKT